MNRLLQALLFVGAVATVAHPVPSARADDDDRETVRRWVPEFSPGAAGAVAAIVAGGGVLLLRRKKR